MLPAADGQAPGKRAMLMEEIKQVGFDNVREIPVSDIPFEPSLIELCEMNSCGNYGKCYTCPPYVGKTEDLIARAKTFDTILVFQKIYRLADSFDIEGMGEGQKDFHKRLDMADDVCRKNLERYLLLGAGGCRRCQPCGVVEGVACRFPDKAFASLESYSIQVSTLAAACGLNYINGQNTVTYFGGILH